MKTTRILPAALAVALFAASGVTHAMAEPNEHFHRGLAMGPDTQLGQSVMHDQAMASTALPKGELTMSQAQQRAKDVIGGGKIIASERYGIHNDLYLFDVEKGASPEQVYVNGETGSVMVSEGLNSYAAPEVVAGPILGTGHQNT